MRDRGREGGMEGGGERWEEDVERKGGRRERWEG